MQPIGELVAQYQAQLKNFIRKRVSTNEDAEDILQEVFYQLTKADSLIRPVENVSAWLYTVARNKITDWLRGKKQTDELPEDDVIQEVTQFLFSDSSSVEDNYLRGVLWQEIDSALAELPQEQREAFELSEFEGLSFKEISEATGTGVNTLISRKRYAVLHLRERLSSLYNDLMGR